MFKSKDQKREKVMELLRTTLNPIPIQSLVDIPPTKRMLDEVKRLKFVKEAVKSGMIEGFITRDREIYWSTQALRAYIQNHVYKYGLIRKKKFARKHNLSLRQIDYIIEDETKGMKGFWSEDGRTFFMTKRAGQKVSTFLKQKRKTTFFELKQKFRWSDKDILKMFHHITDDENLFIGFMNNNNDIFNCDAIESELRNRSSIAVNFFYTYLVDNFAVRGEIFFEDISSCFDKIDKSLTLELLNELKAGGHLKFIPARTGDRIYSYKRVLSMAMRIVRSFSIIPLEFFANHLNLEYVSAMQFLDTMIENFHLGEKMGNNLVTRPADEWISDLMAPEKIAQDFTLSGGPSEALQILYKVCDEEGELIINDLGGVRAVESLDITCQMDGATYDFPDLYFECSSCKRLMCSNCYYSLPKNAPCPFCGNIATFIVDYPRRCNTCGMNYVTVKGREGETLDKCRYCDKGPLDLGWMPMLSKQITEKESLLVSFLDDGNDSDVPFRDIIEYCKMPDLEVMIFIEECINKKIIPGQLDGVKEVLVRKITAKIQKCAIKDCEITPADDSYKCKGCKSVICTECYSELEEVGIAMCMDCGEDYEHVLSK